MLISLLPRRFIFRFYSFLSVCLVLSLLRYWITWNKVEQSESLSGKTQHLSKLLTVVYRQYEEHESDLANSVQSLVSIFPNMAVVVVCETTPYPPLPFTSTNETLRNVMVISLKFRLNSTPQELDPLTYINTEYVLLMPDSATRVSRRVLKQATIQALASPDKAVAIGAGSVRPACHHIALRLVDWTLQYKKEPNNELCDSVGGQHCLLVKKSLLRLLPDPFRLPFPETLYLQTSVRKVKIQLATTGRMATSRSIFKTKNPVARQRALLLEREQKLALYNQLGVKVVIDPDNHVEWFGCNKATQRCFPTVQGTPSYILSRRYTPPCCRRNLRRTVAHVLTVLQDAGARCWLEATSLLGAVTRNDILPWAEYAEIGVYASDISRVTWLVRGGEDTKGFVWELATKGRYYSVAYSAVNRIYTLVLPFLSKNGTMIPDDWVLAHQRDFSEKHLQPLAQVSFAGHTAPAPNDARAFLDRKFGLQAIEMSMKKGPRFLYP